MADTEVEVRQVVYQGLKILVSAREEAEITNTLRALLRYLDNRSQSNTAANQRAEFRRTHYTLVLQALVRGLSCDWFHGLSTDQRRELWDSFFLQGPPDQALLVLLDAISSTGQSAGLDYLVCVLEQFLSSGGVAAMLWARCQVGSHPGDSPQLREALLGRLVSLPDLVCNRLHTHTPRTFLPQQYCPLLATAILQNLEKTVQALRGGQDCSLSFLAHVLGKACAQGHSALLFGTLGPALVSHTHSDVLWQRVSATLLENVPERWMEPTVTGLVQAINSAEGLSRVMGNLVLKNKKAQFVITHKLLLLQYSLQAGVLRSLLGYLALDPQRRVLLTQVLQSVCKVWCNSSAVKHTAVDQQLYVSRVLLICLSLLSPVEIQQLREDLLQCILGGVQCRLDCGTERVRKMGMAVGECLSRKLDTPTAQLKFQYEGDEESRELVALMDPVSVEPSAGAQPDPNPRVTPGLQTEGQCAAGDSVTTPPSASKPSVPQQGSDSELDSDDELTPYDMSADQEKPQATPPRYVRDCLEVLMSSDDAERVEQSLQVAEGLLRRNVSTTREVSVQFSKVLLHLEDRFNTPSFQHLRQRAMVALTAVDTKPVTEYLTTEFYSLNYSLRQRLDMLEVLALSAQELSEPTGGAQGPVRPARTVATLSQCDDLMHWREVVEKRIQSKTKRLSKGVSRPPPTPGPNRYASVAGYFFFPLLRNYDRPQVTFDLLGGDHLVLGRLIHTLGLLMHLAVNAPVATQMGKALLDFVWTVRYHADQMVRRGVLFAVCAVFLSMPNQNLLLEINDELMETRAWLAEVAEGDVDADCRSLALQSLVLLDRSLKAVLQPSTPEHPYSIP